MANCDFHVMPFVVEYMWLRGSGGPKSFGRKKSSRFGGFEMYMRSICIGLHMEFWTQNNQSTSNRENSAMRPKLRP